MDGFLVERIRNHWLHAHAAQGVDLIGRSGEPDDRMTTRHKSRYQLPAQRSCGAGYKDSHYYTSHWALDLKIKEEPTRGL